MLQPCFFIIGEQFICNFLPNFRPFREYREYNTDHNRCAAPHLHQFVDSWLEGRETFKFVNVNFDPLDHFWKGWKWSSYSKLCKNRNPGRYIFQTQIMSEHLQWQKKNWNNLMFTCLFVCISLGKEAVWGRGRPSSGGISPPCFWNEWASHFCADISLLSGSSCFSARRLTDCSGSSLALCATEPLGQWSLLPPCMWCVWPLWSVVVSPLTVPKIHCGLLFVFRLLTPLSKAKKKYSIRAIQQNGSDTEMFRIKIRDKEFLA